MSLFHAIRVLFALRHLELESTDWGCVNVNDVRVYSVTTHMKLFKRLFEVQLHLRISYSINFVPESTSVA